MNKRNLYWKLGYLVVSFGVFMVDQYSKSWAVTRLKFGNDRSIISGFLNLIYAENSGAAFSMLDSHGDASRWGLSAVAILAGALVIYFFWRTPRSDDRMLGALALLLAGIAGNVTDRLRLGYVIDFIDVQFGSWHYPTFNVADIAICIGAGLLIIDMFLTKNQKSAEAISKEPVARSEN